MGKLVPAIMVEPWKTARKLEFSSTEQLEAWANDEAAAWDMPVGKNPQLKQIVEAQKSTFSGLAERARRLGQQLGADDQNSEAIQAARNDFHNSTNAHLESVRLGGVLTSDHRLYPDIRSLAEVDKDAAALLLAASLGKDSRVVSQLFPANLPTLKLVVRAGLTRHAGLGDMKASLDSHIRSLATVKNRGDEAAKSVEDFFAQWIKKRDDDDEEQQNGKRERALEWADKLTAIDDEWKARIKVYDEQMALAAPTTYWSTRVTRSAISAAIYGAAFIGLVVAGMYFFITDAIPYLKEVVAPGASVITAILPVLVPTFVGIWFLRIISRQLSESLQLMKDAGERVVMVKTFLALMNDEIRGKALVTDDDRLLILHSLFRPSSVSATDDAPPVHWFDILSKKFGGSKP
ncbi:hypothetical protein LDO26_00030 [Luteimonas sp. BDR2-5]|uniref:DUF6161 domain-containing protein n=1 Tax=Proluteimonas luteida TaxID=2878685 RepID=UPI001E45782F|nr:DUF6161 domain-containing protein [Luteimonas sp. BDR2-5]MCD9026602.1 hypothetical protein [Luteimonas sp. BDR2-5]